MAGVKGMFERSRRSPEYAEKVRSRIRAGLIAKRLEEHILGNIEMSSTQIQAAVCLLRKVVPDLGTIEHTGAGGAPLELKLVGYHDTLQLPAPALSVADTDVVRLRYQESGSGLAS